MTTGTHPGRQRTPGKGNDVLDKVQQRSTRKNQKRHTPMLIRGRHRDARRDSTRGSHRCARNGCPLNTQIVEMFGWSKQIGNPQATDLAVDARSGSNTSVPEHYFVVVVFHRSMPDPEDSGSGRRAAGPVAQRHAKLKRWRKKTHLSEARRKTNRKTNTQTYYEKTLCYCRDVLMAWSIRHRARKISSVLHLTCALTVATWSRVTQDGTTHAIPSWPSWKV